MLQTEFLLPWHSYFIFGQSVETYVIRREIYVNKDTEIRLRRFDNGSVMVLPERIVTEPTPTSISNRLPTGEKRKDITYGPKRKGTSGKIRR